MTTQVEICQIRLVVGGSETLDPSFVRFPALLGINTTALGILIILFLSLIFI